MRQLLDVLTLLSDDGSHGQRRDEEVHRLRLLGSLLDTSTLASNPGRTGGGTDSDRKAPRFQATTELADCAARRDGRSGDIGRMSVKFGS